MDRKFAQRRVKYYRSAFDSYRVIKGPIGLWSYRLPDTRYLRMSLV